MMDEAIDVLTDAVEEQTKILNAIQKSLSKPANYGAIQDAIDDQTEVLKEVLERDSKQVAPVVNVAVPSVNVPAAVVTVMEAQPVVIENRSRRYLSTVHRNQFGLIETIETKVIE